jgi:hypothetical protein
MHSDGQSAYKKSIMRYVANEDSQFQQTDLNDWQIHKSNYVNPLILEQDHANKPIALAFDGLADLG